MLTWQTFFDYVPRFEMIQKVLNYGGSGKESVINFSASAAQVQKTTQFSYK